MLRFLSICLMSLALVGCGPSAKERKEAIARSVAVRFTPLSPTTVDRDGEWFEYSAQVTNGSNGTIWIQRIATPKAVSSYLTDRNPEALCYEVQKHRNGTLWMDANHGLNGTQRESVTIEPGQTKEFRVPIRVSDATFRDSGSVRIAIWVYSGKKGSDEAQLKSNEVPFPPTTGA